VFAEGGPGALSEALASAARAPARDPLRRGGRGDHLARRPGDGVALASGEEIAASP
jgi:hypothetical protein